MIKVKKVFEEAIIPTRAHEDDAGWDLYANEEMVISPGNRGIIGTGISIEIPVGWAGFVTPRSGLAIKSGISITNSPGIIDPGYRGEIKVILENNSTIHFFVHDKERIAQLLIIPYVQSAL